MQTLTSHIIIYYQFTTLSSNLNSHINNLTFSENMIEESKPLSVFGSAPSALWQDLRIIYTTLSCALLFVILG